MTPKEKIIDKIQDALLNEVQFIREDRNKSTEEKIVQIDVLFDTVKFLKNYDENINVLKKHLREKEK